MRVDERQARRRGATLRALLRQQDRAGVELEPRSAYEAVTREMVVQLGDDIRDLRGRVNAIGTMIAGAIVAEAILRLVGMG